MSYSGPQPDGRNVHYGAAGRDVFFVASGFHLKYRKHVYDRWVL